MVNSFQPAQNRLDGMVARVTALEQRQRTPSPQLLFYDDFETLDLTRYMFQYHWGQDVRGFWGPPNNEQQCYVDGNPKVNGSNLVLTADLASRHPADDALGRRYVSGMVTTAPPAAWAGTGMALPPGYQGFDFKYGRAEARIRLPRGRGLWPGFWMMATDRSWPPEVDVLEAFGGDNGRGEGGPHAVHWAVQQVAGAWSSIPDNIYTDFHIYRLDWHPDRVDFFVDGQQIGSSTGSPNKPMFLILDLAVGGDWPGPVDDSSLPAAMLVDYLRVSPLA